MKAFIMVVFHHLKISRLTGNNIRLISVKLKAAARSHSKYSTPHNAWTMESLLESTAAVAKGLETLRTEHVSLLEELKTSEHQGIKSLSENDL